MSSRSTLTILVGAFSILGFSACKTVYSDTFSYRKNSFKAPAGKVAKIEAPANPILPEGLGAGTGLIPAAPQGLPEGGAIPGIPGAEPAPAAPGVPAVPAVPGL